MKERALRTALGAITMTQRVLRRLDNELTRVRVSLELRQVHTRDDLDKMMTHLGWTRATTIEA